ncbi:MAG: DUF1499 domain-containing protein [Alphaproteobacteria bacterium]|nr:DUF1499 domain-containing protein [Alphaproteobacteria bacterium]
MTSPLALFGRGAAGLPPVTPVEFASLVLPRSPNTCLAAPASHPGFKHLETPLYPVPPAVLIDRLLRIADAMPRTARMAHWPERHQAQWVERTALMNYPDIIVAEAAPAPSGAALFLYSRSLFGYSDLGANRARVDRWLAALAAPG